jgi:hypothetical protein
LTYDWCFIRKFSGNIASYDQRHKKLTGIGSDGVAVGRVVIVGSNDGGIVTVG